MNMKFVDREAELRFLERRYRAPGAQLVIVYGRRRIGKTELLLRFGSDKRHVYFLAPRTVLQDQVARFQAACTEQLRSGAFQPLRADWEVLLAQAGKQRKRTIVIIDEFPYLIESDPAVPSQFQRAWDGPLRKSRIFLILCGSSVSMMENEVLGRKSPLYGRRTGQWRVEPLRFSHFREFFRRYSMRRCVEAYSLLGGIPYYWTQFQRTRSLEWNVAHKLLSKGEVLFEEARILLREELRKPRVYFTILQAVAEGRRKYGHIAGRTGLTKQTLSRYLGVLEELGFLLREVPVTEKEVAKSKRGLYEIRDPYLRFWFRFVFPNQGQLERSQRNAVRRLILPELASYVARSFETLCAEASRQLVLRQRGTEHGLRVGRWWKRTEEIDVVAITDRNQLALLGECKWSDRVNAALLATRLRARATRVFGRDAKDASFAVFARSFSRRSSGVLCIDLPRLGQLLAKEG